MCRVLPDMPAPPPNAVHTPVHVVETSLGITKDVRLLRHLGLRFGEEDSYSEAHFGPSDAGSFHEGFLKIGEGKVAEADYLAEIPAGVVSLRTCDGSALVRKQHGVRVPMPVFLSKSSRAGETSLTKEEALEWCEKWAKDKKYVMVGQNCWTMVHEFLTTHEGCELTDEIQCAVTHFLLLAVPHAVSNHQVPAWSWPLNWQASAAHPFISLPGPALPKQDLGLRQVQHNCAECAYAMTSVSALPVAT